MVFGWSAAPVSSAQVKQENGLFAGYGLDTLGDAPNGSLAEGCLALLAGRNGEGR